MAHELISYGDPTSGALGASAGVPALIVSSAGTRGAMRFLEFFAANIRNPNTRRAYYRAVCEFFRWCEERHIAELSGIQPMHVAAYVEKLLKSYSKPSVKQSLAAVRMLFDWLVVGQVVPLNPAAVVRGPKHVVRRGKTPVLAAEEARQLLDSIDISSVVGLRDRALIALMTYTFARVGAAIAMNVEDYYPQSRRWWVRLHEKGGKRHEMPTHHNLDTYLSAYMEAAGLADQKKAPLFPTAIGRTQRLSRNRM